MRVAAALRRWAAEHNQHLSAATRSEVDVIASILEASSLRDREILALGPDFGEELAEVFPGERAERAETLIDVVGEWALSAPSESQAATVAEVRSTPVAPAPQVATAVGAQASAGAAELNAPAFLRSDRVDEEDDDRLFGSARSYLRIVLAGLSVVVLAAVAVGVWLWASSNSTDPAEVAEDSDPAGSLGDPSADSDGAGAADPATTPTVAPSPTPEPILAPERTPWADTTTVLNSGTATLLASTYPVHPANRAVLNGHADAVTGIAVSDDGRVLTSGADRRLVDWGNEVTLASPDLLTLDSPLTALIRTVDQRLIVGDATGGLTVIDLMTPGEPTAIAVHASAVSAIAELADGRIAAASVDGSVALLAPAAPGDVLNIEHAAEVTALAALADGRLATASVDGLVRIWPPTGGSPEATIDTLGSPVTALTLLSDGRLAAASVDGKVHVFAAADAAVVELEIHAHHGAIRALLEFEDGVRGPSLATGGDDSTIRLFSLATGELWQQLDGHGDLVSAIAQLPDGPLVSTSADGTGRMWDLTRLGGPIVEPPHEWNLSHLAPWRNDQFITGGVDGRVMLASTAEGTPPEPITQHDAPIVGVTVMPNGDIISLDAASVLRLSQVGPDATEPLELSVAIGATALDDRGTDGIVTGHADGSVRLSDLTSETVSVTAHSGAVRTVLGLSNGLIASGGDDNTVRVIDPAEPDIVPVFDLHTGPVTALAELADGRVASASDEGIFVWSTDDMGAEFVHLAGHRGDTIGLYALADGRLLSTTTDGRVRLWNLEAPNDDAVTLVDVPGIVNPVVIQADNGLFVSGAGRGYVVFALE